MARLILPLLLVAVPLAEIVLFVMIGGRIGVLATVAVVVATALAGAAMLRLQGLAILREVQRQLDAGRLPLGPLVDGLGLFAAGLLLLTPGFLTDAIGFLLLVPALRRRLAALVVRRLAASGRFTLHAAAGPRRHGRPGEDGPVIEADYRETGPGGDEGKTGGDDSPRRMDDAGGGGGRR